MDQDAGWSAEAGFRHCHSRARAGIGSCGHFEISKRLSGHARSHPRHGALGREQRRDFEGAGGRLSLDRGWAGGATGRRDDCRTEVVMSLISRLVGRFWKLPAPITRDIASQPLRIPMRDGGELLADRYYPRAGPRPRYSSEAATVAALSNSSRWSSPSEACRL